MLSFLSLSITNWLCMASSESRSAQRSAKGSRKDGSFTSQVSQGTSAETEKLISQVQRDGNDGKMLVWQDVVATVPTHGGEGRKVVLKEVNGCAWPGEVLAIMGGSGAGKTTLMNILAHLDTKGVEKEGTVFVNGRNISKTEMRKISAYVQQVDVFCGTLTVREQLTYSALLRMGPSFTKEEKMERVEKVIGDMNLIDCQKTIIGIPNRVKGISIGEKKRLAFACEVLTNPAILFCDEPTSGLDAFMASQVVTALRNLAQEGKTIISVIHQPSSTVFNMFDKVLFMANGRPAYHGPVPAICKFFESMNIPEMRVPVSYNPADHVVGKLSVNPETKEKDIKQIQMITEHFEKSAHGLVMQRAVKEGGNPTEGGGETDQKGQGYGASFMTQFTVLFRRAFLTTLRDPLLLKVRLIQVVATAIIIAIVNWQTPLTGPSIQNMEGVMYNTARDMNFLFLFPSINVITSELPVFMREYKAHIYSVESYFFSKSLAELPQYTILPIIYSIIVYWSTGLFAGAQNFIIFTFTSILMSYTAVSVAYAGACVFGDEGQVVTYLPMLILPMLVFGGFYIKYPNIPIYFKPFSFLSWFRYGFESLQLNQWKSVDYIEGCTGLLSSGNNTEYCPGEDGQGILEMRGMNGSIILNLTVLFIFFLGYRFIGLFALRLRANYAK